MTKRRAAWIGVAAVTVALVAAGGLLWLLTLPIGINEDGFNAIRVGMTQRQVEAILGGPPGRDEVPAGLPAGHAGVEIMPAADLSAYRRECWRSDIAEVIVYFGSEGAVAHKGGAFDFSNRPPTPLLVRLRLWLGL
jgi:hypothetical protein